MDIYKVQEEFEEIINQIGISSSAFNMTELQHCIGLLYSMKAFINCCFEYDEEEVKELNWQINQVMNQIEKRKVDYYKDK
jgi:hypothetical protein